MRPVNLKTVFGLTAIAGLALTSGAQTNPRRQPIAYVAGQMIYEQDLTPSIGAQLMQLRNQEYELKLKALSSLVKQRLLEQEATGSGLSTEAFLKKNVDPHVASPSETEIEAYYQARKDAVNRTLDEVRLQIEAALIRDRRQQARQDYMDKLLKNAAVSILLERPRVDVNADTSRLRGSADAPVMIIEFADFQCPYCKGAEQILKFLMDKYKDKIRVSVRDFPLRQFHPQSQEAAEASRCAGEQGKFWEYQDLLYANQGWLDPNGLRGHARAAGLDAGKFEECLKSGKFAAAVESDFQAGLASGVSSTPTFFINGIVLAGLQPASSFEKIIDSELEETALRKAGGSAKAVNTPLISEPRD